MAKTLNLNKLELLDKKTNAQQLGFRRGCKPNNENRVEPILKSGQATDYTSGNTMELSKSFEKE